MRKVLKWIGIVVVALIGVLLVAGIGLVRQQPVQTDAIRPPAGPDYSRYQSRRPSPRRISDDGGHGLYRCLSQG